MPSRTQNALAMDTPNTDGQIFVGASEFIDTAGFATTASAGAGLFSKNIPASDAATFFANVTAIMRRTGMFATPSSVQEQFGTAASQPGPSAVSGTSDPLAIDGFPPFLAAALPTLAGPVTGAIPKGYRIKSMDVIYEINTVDATVATCGLTVTQFVNAVAPVVTNRIALGANGLPVAHNAAGAGKPYVINVPVPSPVFSVASDGETIVNVNITPGAGGTAKFYGVVLYCDFNLN
jgi:hypothetical protein